MEDKIINNNFDNVEYGTEGLLQTPIAISPLVSDRYEESISENIEDIYIRKKINEDLYKIYASSPFYSKYGTDPKKKIEKKDMFDIYYSFKTELIKEDYSLVQIVCAIAEFFQINYKTLYNDVLSLEDKAVVLETLREMYGLDKDFAKSKQLF